MASRSLLLQEGKKIGDADRNGRVHSRPRRPLPADHLTNTRQQGARNRGRGLVNRRTPRPSTPMRPGTGLYRPSVRSKAPNARLKMSAVAARPSSDSVTREAAHGVPTITVDCGEEGERQSGRVPAVTKRGAIGRQPSSVNCPPSPSRRQNSSTRASGDESGARGDSTRASATARDVSGPAPTMTAVATTPTGTCASGYRPIRFGLTTIPASRSSPEVPWRRPRHEHIG
jgi:hypothetical protein